MKAVVLASCLALAAGMSGFAHAKDWEQHNVRDHLQGVVGKGAETKGSIEDGRRKSPAGFGANCSQNSTTVYIEADWVYFGSQAMSVRYTLDGGPVQQMAWTPCKGSRCAGVWGGGGIAFLKSLFDKTRLRMVLDRAYAEPLNADFPIEGAREALTEAGQLCGWLPKSAPPAAPAKK